MCTEVFKKIQSFNLKTLLLLVLTIFMLSSCDHKNARSGDFQNYEVKEIHFPIDSTISKESNTIQYFEEQGQEYLVVFNKPTDEIIWFDFEQRNVAKRTTINTQGPHTIGQPFGIHIKSKDSLFVLSSATYSLALLDEEGMLIQDYKLFKGALDFNGRPKDSENSIKPILQSTNPLIILSDSVVALAGLPDANPLNTDFYNSQVYMRLNLNSGAIDYKIPYPERYRNKLWGLYHSFPFHSFNNNTGEAVISFPASSTLYKTDFQTLDSTSAPSHHIKEPSSWKDPEANGLKMMRFFLSAPSFYRIDYDPYRNLYYRFSQVPSSKDLAKADFSQLSIFNSKDTYLSILDEELNMVQEMLVPKRYDPRFIFTAPDGLYIAKENENEDQLTFGLLNFL